MSRQWVLIRGMMSEAFHWRDLIPLMKERFPRDVIHTANLLGTGPTGRTLTPVHVKKNLAALRRQTPERGEKTLVGFSLGGMLALEWAYEHPDEVEAVVLINCSLGNAPFYKRMRPGALATIARASLHANPIQREKILLGMTTSLCQERMDVLAREWLARGTEFPVHPLNFFTQLGLAARIGARKTPPPVKTYVVSGGDDKVVHPDCSRLIAEKWGLPLIVHPTAGHDLSLDDPHWLVDQLHAHLAARPDASPDANAGSTSAVAPDLA